MLLPNSEPTFFDTRIRIWSFSNTDLDPTFLQIRIRADRKHRDPLRPKCPDPDLTKKTRILSNQYTEIQVNWTPGTGSNLNIRIRIKPKKKTRIRNPDWKGIYQNR